MQTLVIIDIFILGLVLGSFVNAVQYRINKKVTLRGRSMCVSCKHTLAWFELVPIFSWLFLGGKCRYCSKEISAQYPVVELASAFGLLALTYYFGVVQTLSVAITNPLMETTTAIGLLLVLSAINTSLVLLALNDYKTGYVLSYWVYGAMLLTFVLHLLIFPGGDVITYFAPFALSSLGAAAPFALLHFGSRGKWMGAGDIELAALIGLLLGFPLVIVSLYMSFIIGAVVGLSLVYLRKYRLKSEMPFGPFLVLGVYLAAMFGTQVVELYVRMFIG